MTVTLLAASFYRPGKIWIDSTTCHLTGSLLRREVGGIRQRRQRGWKWEHLKQNIHLLSVAKSFSCHGNYSESQSRSGSEVVRKKLKESARVGDTVKFWPELITPQIALLSQHLDVAALTPLSQPLFLISDWAARGKNMPPFLNLTGFVFLYNVKVVRQTKRCDKKGKRGRDGRQ